MFETKFSNGTEITDYQAVAYAEGFEECPQSDAVRAWAYIIKKRLYLSLQGWFGRVCQQLINANFIDNEGIINWEAVEADDYKL